MFEETKALMKNGSETELETTPLQRIDVTSPATPRRQPLVVRSRGSRERTDDDLEQNLKRRVSDLENDGSGRVRVDAAR